MSVVRPLLLLALSGLLGACATKPAAPPLQSRADDANRRGLEQLRQGEAERALASFERVLTLEQSIEREAGIARAWYNLSVAYQRLGRDADADRALDAVLLDDVRRYPPDQLAEIAFRKAVLAMARGDTGAATTALARTRQHCGEACDLAGPMLNLEARVALADARHDDALALLAEAADRNRRDPVEAANTARLQAATLLAVGRTAEAATAARSALQQDKALGHSERIYQDLMLLAQAASSPADRRAYLMRAGDVARARGDLVAVRRVAALLESAVSPPPTTPEGVP